MADLFAGQPVSLEAMLGCVRREMSLRHRVFPRLVSVGRMKQETADRELQVMGELEKLLEFLVARRWTVEMLRENAR